MTFNSHNNGVGIDTFTKNIKLNSTFNALTTTVDINGKVFVSSMEARNYPFYGLQFHPEKSQFSFEPSAHFNHSAFFIKHNRYFSDFFVNDCKENNYQFSTYDQEMSEIVEHYDVIPTTTYYGSVYVF